MTLKITVLGSGTSTGVPVIGCPCAVCRDPGINRRRRSSILITDDKGRHIVVDTGPDFREQMLDARVTRLRDVLYTHLHADHTAGFDDLRAFHFEGKELVRCHIAAEQVAEFRGRFAYAFHDDGYAGTKPQVEILPYAEGMFRVLDLDVEAVPLVHGPFTSYAFRIGAFAYATDFQFIPDAVIARWRGRIDLMVASGVHFRPLKAHSSVPETLALFEKLQVKRGVVTHLSHEVDARVEAARLPPHVTFAHDGMVVGC